MASPTVGGGQPAGNLEDLMGLSNGAGVGQANGDHAHADIVGGFASLDMSAVTQPPPPQEQLAGDGGGGKKTNQDLLDLF